MAMVDDSQFLVDSTAQVSWLCLRVSSQLAFSLHSSNEPGELLSWLLLLFIIMHSILIDI